MNLGTLGGAWSNAIALSADGAVVAGHSATAGGATHAFRWTSGGMQDLGTLGGSDSYAVAVSANGAVVAGHSVTAGGAMHAFRWTSGGMQDLGTLGGAGSYAIVLSADGAVVAGHSVTAGGATHAFRWTSGGIQDLGTLGGAGSYAVALSADGAVAAGHSVTAGGATHAFRWTSGGMQDLGTLGGSDSYAVAVSANGAVVAGHSATAGGATHAFRWTSGGMQDLGTLGGTDSSATALSADGVVAVGASYTAGGASRAFRWTQTTGMQSVEDWLRTSGITVPTDITSSANAISSDGSVVAGQLVNGNAFVARVAPTGSGLVTLADVGRSLAGTGLGSGMALASGALLLNGAHGRPLARRVATGQKTFWVAGDLGTDDHGNRSGQLGLAELGVGKNFGPAQLNASLGRTWTKQDLVLNGHARTDGTYLFAEVLVPVSGKLWAAFGGYRHWGRTDLRRGYLNAGAQAYSTGTPDADTWGLRGRLEWEGLWRAAGTDFSPYVDVAYSKAKLAAYTETGGGFPARFHARREKATELRLGVNATKPLHGDLALLGTLEAVHRFEREGAATSGEVIGLFSFALDGARNLRDWLHAGAGIEGKLGGGAASLTLNLTTKGETPNAWLAAGWRMAF